MLSKHWPMLRGFDHGRSGGVPVLPGVSVGGCMTAEEKLELIDKIYNDGFEVEPKDHKEGHYYGILSAIYSVIHFGEDL